MPRRSRAETMTVPSSMERPSTSGGLPEGGKGFDKPDFSKRVSRDDLALILKSSNVKSYHVPIPGRLPSPEYSPRREQPHSVTMVRTASPESMADTGESGIIAIGMALGNPDKPLSQDHAPAAWRTQRSMTAAPIFAEPHEDHEAGQQKSRKWGLFRSKSKRSRTADQASTQRSWTDNSNASSTSINTREHRSGSYSRNQAQQDAPKKTPKHKPIVIRSQTDPGTPARPDFRESAVEKQSPKETRLAAKESKSGGVGRKVSLRALRGDRSRKAAEVPMPLPSPPPPVPQLSGPLLNVEIPSIKMERYSVMFGDVLGSRNNNNSSSSLLARRQATLDRLKSLNDEITENGEEELPRPRRATSPQPNASPSFSLFPGAPRATPTLPSPRLRSNTSPALLHSPVRPAFNVDSLPRKEKPEPETRQARALTSSSVKDVKKSVSGAVDSPKLRSKFSKNTAPSVPKHKGSNSDDSSKTDDGRRGRDASPASLEVDAPPRRRQRSPFTPDTSSLILDSDEDDDAEVNIHITEKLRPVFDEPKWQMVSPPVSTTSLSSPGTVREPSSTRRPSPPSSLKSSEQITVTKPRKPSTPDPEEALRNAVEISIARQISVSHQQRHMLHPLKSNPSLRRRPDGKAPGYGIPVGKNERLAETKTATPRLVRPEDMQTWEMHRKSSRVILEGEP